MVFLLPLFGKRTAGPSESEREAAAVDLQRIAEGGIPLGAEQRLAALRTADSPTFSSDLSAKEYALAQASGLTPIAQVMGSSVVQHGWTNYGWAGYGGGIREMASFAEPWNLSRELSFDRLRQEAQYAGADAVIGIEMNVSPFLGEPGNVELAVFGTAMRDSSPATRRDRRGPSVRMCALSGQDVDKLRRIGAETLGVVGHTSVVAVALDRWSNQRMSGWWGNSEMTEVSEAVYAARDHAMRAIRHQGSELGANDLVISTLDHRIDHHEYDSGGYTQHIFIVSMHVLGTAIRLGAHDPVPAPLGLPMMAINLSDR